MLTERNIAHKSFLIWLRQDMENRMLVKFSMLLVIAQFILFKTLYPYPNFMPPDSISYIVAALDNQSINMWAIGYSKFLRLVSSFTSSHFALISFQYILLQAAVLYFLFTIKYLVFIGKWTFRIIIGCSVLNPLLPHVSNLVSSDALFAGLSLIWFTQLLTILYLPTRRLLLFHSLTLLLAFIVRYNALFYPLISISVILLAPLCVRGKLVNIGLIVLLLGGFIWHTKYHYYTETGTNQYSAFGGWQIAANALYGYAHAIPDAPEMVPLKFRPLHVLVNRHMDSIRDLVVRPDREVAIYYLWDEQSPLVTYLHSQTAADSSLPYFERWAKVAPLYAEYGWYLILKHPFGFMRYYLWPNLIKYYVPPAKFLSVYNLRMETVDPIVVRWFELKSNKVSTYYKDKRILVTEYCSIFWALANIFVVLGFAAFIYLSGFCKSVFSGKGFLWLFLVVWMSNLFFGVIAAPIELRYQLFPMIITIVFVILIIQYIAKISLSVSKEE
ncbi:hypothetical protein F0L74_21495 [Chitinophaga agrisoli]|uniref:Dolichyl-phosphate-mannose-protein mannosyltransferase n=1 Tax=Chitinophaga agrisoli TaxID=2607653 RepID=A0A5B2VGU2_9BACT|nr:hypothetical protein [Chitinophaga agrisoli]KAA2238793.1 hypothetical protein F0L74_21495 [Chitinophaga agrisoli]